MKKKLAVFFCACSLAVTTLAGCSSPSPEKIGVGTPEPERKEIDHNEEMGSNLGLWGRAMGSVLLYLNDGSPYYFGGYMATEENKKSAGNILASSWEINNRKELLAQIQLLLKTGSRKNFYEEAKDMEQMSEKELKRAMKQLSGDLLIHYQMVQYNWETWKKKGLLAWDMCRISHLAQWGYIAGYVDGKEAQALIEPAAKKLKEKFTSWDEVQNNWLDGYCLFADIDREASHSDYTNRLAIYEKLKAEQSEGDLLYDDSLFTAEIIPVSGVSWQELLKEAG
ncbi:MAG: DUF1266 domain-containing protein [Lachnospiraceae bacterium]|nr:DUF1266 domain-containing protein [Lachnospiraceae bacterium]